jgi:hypothetical protein
VSRELADRVRRLDPLGADAFCAQAPTMNARADTTALVSALGAILPGEREIAAFEEPECLAAMRDLGLFLGSIRRHGVEPVRALPAVEWPLLLLGRRMDMVPRDTVFHYGLWNPLGVRQRMYTGDPGEDVLIHAVRIAAPSLESCLSALERALDVPPDDPALADLCARSAGHLESVVDSLDFVREALPPLFFARVLRPYFQEIAVDGLFYLGPAAAHLPLYLVDHLLWSSDRADPDHYKFQHETARHAPPAARALFDRREGRPSLSGRVSEALRASEERTTDERASAALHASAEGICRLFHLLITFRGRHLVLARREYAEEVRLFPAGSGGGTVELLERILMLTRTCAEFAHQPIATAVARPGARRQMRGR